MPRDQVQGRLHNIVSSANLVYGLVFSGVAGTALSPLNVNEFDKGSTERTLVNFYNFAATLQFVICISGVLFTTFILMFLNAIPDTAIFRCVANFDWIMLYPYLIFYSLFLLAAQMFSAIILRSDEMWGIITCACGFLIFLLLFSHWIWAQRAAFPNTTMQFLPAFAVLSFNPFTWTFLFGNKYAKYEQACKTQADAMIQVRGGGRDIKERTQKAKAKSRCLANTRIFPC